ncbi:MAG: S8 family serine peptidase [Gemmatimonadetes bacterium]|nr:S8 family serine peptidase [Gemmatimonadota bacterium]
MSRSRISITLIGAIALAACNADRIDQVSPLTVSPSHVVSAAAPARYLVLAKNSGFKADFAARVAALGGTVEQLHTGAGIAVVSNLSAAATSKLGGFPEVSDVQADADVALDAPVAANTANVADVSINSVGNPTTAILYPWQWNMQVINASAAWAAGKLGDAGVTVAILDTGIDYNAFDLNGLVDLSRSTSFVPSDDAIATAFFPSRNKVTDFNGHGTNVATQVSSKAVVFAGVTSKTTLIAVKVLGASGSGSTSGVLNGVLWAADHGADVANMSLGSSFAKAGNGRFVSLINRVFNYAASKGMLIVVAAGNAAADLDHNGNVENAYCDATHVVCVSSVGPALATDNPTMAASYSNFGRSAISVAAPGGNADLENFTVSNWPWGPDIASWVWSLCSKTYISGISGGAPVTPCAAGNRLAGEIGTSQASPHVAGLAALLVAEQGHGRPSQIKAAILKSAIDLGQPGTDPFYGRGLINVANAFGL